jgi:hypothetical protein
MPDHSTIGPDEWIASAIFCDLVRLRAISFEKKLTALQRLSAFLYEEYIRLQ